MRGGEKDGEVLTGESLNLDRSLWWFSGRWLFDTKAKLLFGYIFHDY
jgi:hypothetical protein